MPVFFNAWRAPGDQAEQACLPGLFIVWCQGQFGKSCHRKLTEPAIWTDFQELFKVCLDGGCLDARPSLSLCKLSTNEIDAGHRLVGDFWVLCGDLFERCN